MHQRKENWRGEEGKKMEEKVCMWEGRAVYNEREAGEDAMSKKFF